MPRLSWQSRSLLHGFCSLLLHNVALLLSSSTQWKSSQDIRFAEVEVYMTPSAILFTKQTKIRRVGYCRGEPIYRIHPTPALPLLQNENSTVTGKGISDTSHPLHLQKRDSSWSCPSIVCGSRGCPAVRRSPTLCVASLQPRWCRTGLAPKWACAAETRRLCPPGTSFGTVDTKCRELWLLRAGGRGNPISCLQPNCTWDSSSWHQSSSVILT